MRILHVVPSYVPAWRYGGPIRSVHGLCKAMHHAGHEVEVYTTNADGPGNLDVPLSRPVDVDGVKVWYFPDLFRRLYWSPEMVDALDRTARQFDIVHLHSIYLWPTTAGARAARRAAVPYVVSPRGMLIPELIRGRSRRIKTAWIWLFERSNLANAAALHFTSTSEATEAAKLGLEFKRAFIIPNGADAELIADSPGRGTARDSEPPFLLFIGRISWEKGLNRLIAALALVPEVRLVIAGQGEQKLRERLDSVARQARVESRVDFMGMVEGDRKAQLLAHALALVLPSYSESFGNVVLEAMAASCPVVVTPEVGAAEVILESGAGIVLDGDPRILGEGIRKLLGDRKGLAAMGRRGRESFERNFTWSAVAHRMIGAYQDIRA